MGRRLKETNYMKGVPQIILATLSICGSTADRSVV